MVSFYRILMVFHLDVVARSRLVQFYNFITRNHYLVSSPECHKVIIDYVGYAMKC